MVNAFKPTCHIEHQNLKDIYGLRSFRRIPLSELEKNQNEHAFSTDSKELERKCMQARWTLDWHSLVIYRLPFSGSYLFIEIWVVHQSQTGQLLLMTDCLIAFVVRIAHDLEQVSFSRTVYSSINSIVSYAWKYRLNWRLKRVCRSEWLSLVCYTYRML